MKLTAVILSVSLLASTALAEKLVISGRVLDTAGAINDDKPLGQVPVVILDASGKPLKQTTTRDNGYFDIEFNDERTLTGRETVSVDASGYSERPTSQQINLKRPSGMKRAFQGDFLLTNSKAIRESATYREAVTKNAINTHANAAQAERARRVFASISALPPESKEIAFGSVRAASTSAFSELQIVDKKLATTRELATEFTQRGSFVVPLYDPSGKIRFTGPANSEEEIDVILQRAGQKGFKGNAVINDMQIRKQ